MKKSKSETSYWGITETYLDEKQTHSGILYRRYFDKSLSERSVSVQAGKFIREVVFKLKKEVVQ